MSSRAAGPAGGGPSLLALPAVMSMAASASMAMGALLIARLGGVATLGEFVAVSSVAVLLALPLTGGLHVVASRQRAAGMDAATVNGSTAVVFLAASVAVSLAGVGLWLGLAAALPGLATVWLLAIPVAISTGALVISDALVRVDGHQVHASAARLTGSLGYLVAVLAVPEGKRTAATYLGVTLGSALLTVFLDAIVLLRARPTAKPPVIRQLVREGAHLSWAQASLTVTFGLDVLVLHGLVGAQAVGLYALLSLIHI